MTISSHHGDSTPLSVEPRKSRTFARADNSDHDLVLMTVKLKLKKNLLNRGPRLKFNLEKLIDLQKADLFEARIGGKFTALNLVEVNIDNLTGNIHGTLADTTSEVLGKAMRKEEETIGG